MADGTFVQHQSIPLLAKKRVFVQPVKKKVGCRHTFTLRQKVALVMLATVDFMSFCSMSIMAPFYPKEAAAKGMTELTAGFVFGFYALVVMLSSPVFGKVVSTYWLFFGALSNGK